jgi:hypothetical protein
MATAVNFNGSRLLQPGAYSRVNAEGLQIANPGAYNVVCVMGRAHGGEPMKPLLFSDPIAAINTFGPGTPLADAVRFAFQGSNKGGAKAVLAVRVDPTAKATGSLAAVNGGPQIDAEFDDWGDYGNTYAVAFSPGTSDGLRAIVTGKMLNGGDYRANIDNVPDFTTLLKRINNETPMNLVVQSGGTKASQTVSLSTSQIDGRASITGAQGSLLTSQAYMTHYPASVLTSNESMVASFAGTLDWPISAIDVAANTFTATGNTIVAGNDVRISGTTLPPEVSPLQKYICYGAGSSFTVVPLLAIPVSFAVSSLAAGTFTCTGHTHANGDVVQFGGTTLPTSGVLGRRYFVVGVAGNNLQLAATPGGTAIAFAGASLTNLTITKVAGSAVLDITGTIAGGNVTLDPGLVSITGSTPTNFNGARSTVRSMGAYSVTATNASISARPIYGSDAAKITLYGGETWGYANGRAMPGTVFTIATGTYAGTYQILGDEFEGTGVDTSRIVRKLSGDRKVVDGVVTSPLAFLPSLYFDAPQPSTLLRSRLQANGLLATGGQAVTLKVGDENIYIATEAGDTIESVAGQLVAAINEDTSLPVVAASIFNQLTFTSTIALTAKIPGDLRTAVGLTVNANETLIVTNNGTQLSGGSEPPPPRNAAGQISGVITLTNGYNSTDVQSRYEQALEQVVQYESVYWVTPATGNQAIQQAVADHCQLMSQTAKRRERRLVTGHNLGMSYTEINNAATAFNSARAIYVSSGQRMSDGNGASRMYPAWMVAARIAGALVAEGISDTLTHTYFQDFLESELQYRSGSPELDAAISAGVLAIEVDPSVTRTTRGFRVARAITTYVATGAASGDITNAFQEISVLTQSDHCAATIRDMEESLFIGGRIDSVTFNYVVSAINQRLLQMVREKEIGDFDARSTTIRLSDQANNAVEVGYRIKPLNGLDFMLNTQTLVPFNTTVSTVS